jgi:hypothetical protein
MGEKLGGVGLQNIFVIWILVLLMTVAAKVIFTRYNVPGLSEIVQAA